MVFIIQKTISEHVIRKWQMVHSLRYIQVMINGILSVGVFHETIRSQVVPFSIGTHRIDNCFRCFT